MNLILLDFISGIKFGWEMYLKDGREEEDVFACTLDLLIIRITFVRKRA